LVNLNPPLRAGVTVRLDHRWKASYVGQVPSTAGFMIQAGEHGYRSATSLPCQPSNVDLLVCTRIYIVFGGAGA